MLRRRASVRSSILLCIGVVLLGLAAPSYAGQTNIVGGEGGSAFRIECPSGAFIFGFDIRFGKALDQIKPYCAQVRDGKFTDERSQPGWTGGNGGSPGKVFCPGWNGLAGLDVFLDPKQIVRQLTMKCYLPGNSQMNAVSSPSIGSYYYNESLQCPPNQFANGIVGRSGVLIDAIGLLCAEPPAAVNKPLPASPKPIKKTGRPRNPQPADAATIAVLLNVQVYDAPEENVIGELNAGDRVTLVGCNADDWCKVRGDKVPTGQGFVYSGDSYRSLAR